MTARLVTCIVLDCDLCGTRLDADDRVLHFDTEEEAAAYATDIGWTELGRGRIACTASDPAHDDACDALRVPAA
ncbi:hypothetical protein [Streptomyces sp. KN37]|uniref:hypothetical protein n=1 Tax=Streptomyces sp. KN37 TaxID=3090667 RepID=UPI002A75BAF1|nr:hypothetical protein [Streptomyces sp. KN37]WPO73979.1 hypothetical protein R9806_26855 [Streptomyces sp. KN37]